MAPDVSFWLTFIFCPSRTMKLLEAGRPRVTHDLCPGRQKREPPQGLPVKGPRGEAALGQKRNDL